MPCHAPRARPSTHPQPSRTPGRGAGGGPAGQHHRPRLAPESLCRRAWAPVCPPAPLVSSREALRVRWNSALGAQGVTGAGGPLPSGRASRGVVSFHPSPVGRPSSPAAQGANLAHPPCSLQLTMQADKLAGGWGEGNSGVPVARDGGSVAAAAGATHTVTRHPGAAHARNAHALQGLWWLLHRSQPRNGAETPRGKADLAWRPPRNHARRPPTSRAAPVHQALHT